MVFCRNISAGELLCRRNMSAGVLLLLLLLLKKVGSARLREGDVHHISPKTPTPQYQPIDSVEDYSREVAA